MNAIGVNSNAPSQSELVEYYLYRNWPDHPPQAWDREAVGFADPSFKASNVANTRAPHAQAGVIMSGTHNSRKARTDFTRDHYLGNCQIRAVQLLEVVIGDLKADGI